MFDFLEKLFHRVPKPAGYFTNAVEIESGEWLKIVPVGYFPNHHDGAHQIERRHIDEMKRNFDASKVDLLFDYEHRSLWGQSVAAGWGKEVEAREDGLYVKAPEWTARAKEMIEGKEYRYLSPVYRLTTKNKLGIEIGATIISVGLTNTPYFDNEIDGIANSTSAESDMKFSADFLTRLGLAESATAEQIEEKVNSLTAGAGDPNGNKPAAGSPEAAPAEGDKPKAPAAGEAEALPARVKPLQDAQQVEAAAEALVNSAIAEGRIMPADKAVWINSARVDLPGTTAALQAKPARSAMPGKVGKPAGTAANSKLDAAADFIRSRMVN